MWGLGVWYRCCGKSTQDEALALARSLREARMPCDVFGLEPGWQSHAYSCSLVWSAERFGDPDRLLAELGGMGFRTNLWEHAFVHPDSPLYETARFRAGDEEVWGGAVPDLALPEMREAFARHHDRTLVSRGVSGFKLDECDNSDFIGSPWSFPEYSRFPSGLDGEQMHSAFGILYQQTMLDPFRGRDIRTYGQVRSSGAFAAPYPYVLYSDLYDHRDFLRGVVNCGFSCLLWSPEVREARSVDELVRRLQAVVFSPQALLNAWYMQHPPWRQIEAKKNADGEFMPEWRAVEDRCRLILQMRMRLVPYLYAAFAQYRFAGKPPFRALVLDWPDDPACRDLGDQYMMGDDLLVAPIPADAEGRAVYLPAGAWYDLATGLRREGGATIDVPAGAAEIPVFVRGGAILPLAEPVDFVAADTVFRIEALTHGEPSRPCVLFEDDGESWAFESGACNRVELRWDPVRGPEVRREGTWPGRRYEVVSWTHRR